MPRVAGIDELVEALDGHRARLDLPAVRLRARRQAALQELLAEHGEHALRALGGRRGAERVLEEEDPAADTGELLAALAHRAGLGR